MCTLCPLALVYPAYFLLQHLPSRFTFRFVESFGIMEALLFGSLISAVDPVATLSILGNPEIKCDPLLYNLVFGESKPAPFANSLPHTLKRMHAQTYDAAQLIVPITRRSE